MKILIKNGNIVLPDRVVSGSSVLIQDDRIVGIDVPDDGSADTITDASGRFVMPGMIDIHSDMIESYIQPRSTAIMGFSMGFMEAERVLAMCGITTMFHSISMYKPGAWDVKEIRKAPQVKKLASLVQRYQKELRLIRHRYHLRYEIDNLDCYEEIKQMIKSGLVDLISFMDHSPGQGQYRNLEIYRKHLPDAGTNITDEEFGELIHRELSKDSLSFEQLKALADLAREKGISVASHDDDSLEKLEVNEKFGVKISEFPVTLQIAREAAERGFLTVLGAPNILLRGSHSGNLSALDAVRADAASVLVSDYYPQALLQAVFQLFHEGELPLWKAVRLVTANPAEAAGIDGDVGTIEIGKKADLLFVNDDPLFPVIERVYVDGKCILDCTYRGGKGI